jgi:hypothetical protein
MQNRADGNNEWLVVGWSASPRRRFWDSSIGSFRRRIHTATLLLASPVLYYLPRRKLTVNKHLQPTPR